MTSSQAAAQVATTILLLFTTGALAEDDPLVGDRPDFTESAITVAPGRVQVEAGLTQTEAGDVETLEVGELLVRIGLSERFELRVGVNSYARIEAPGAADRSGLVDSSLGAKLRLGQRAGWTTAVLFGSTLPTGSDELGEPDAQPEVVLAAERDLTETVSLGTNVGYAWASSGGNRVGEAFGSAALGVGLAESVGAFFEVFGTVPLESGEPETWFFDTGVTKALGPNLQLDLRVGVGLNSAADDVFAGAGVVWRR